MWYKKEKKNQTGQTVVIPALGCLGMAYLFPSALRGYHPKWARVTPSSSRLIGL